jgi:hypothetical protein
MTSKAAPDDSHSRADENTGPSHRFTSSGTDTIVS